jgi:hypothetical protein
MKPVLHVKTALLLLYVACCLHLVWGMLDGESFAVAPLPHIGGE